ncbi:uncharacterized protein LOC111053679 [Nilaparvata lugens]|uniref:uncharacterized protein LOC111053679 n=1 Tax=Nilaparvata lugens TaxID=108931 RepID=UPI00193CF93E|nr:uncharacterized protein LOC111053679 [Nilaparvata lugens]
MCASAKRNISLIILFTIVGPVAILSHPVYESDYQFERTMNELNGFTVCPFTSHNVTTGGIPEVVPEYRCQTNKMSDKNDNSVGKCMKGRECVQGTSTIMIKMADRVDPVPKTFYTGCFCVSQTVSSPKPASKPSISQ